MMGSPAASARRRYPSPLIKQDLAKLGKDAESRRAALTSLRCVVEEHIDSSSLPRFLQQIEDSRDGRRHVAPILQDLARAHGPSLAPHIPRLLHLLVHNLLASTACPPLLGACADAVHSVARYCAGSNADEILRQVCLPLLALLPNKIPPLSTGAAVCLRTLVASEQWRFAPPSLVDDLCWKAAMAAAAPPTQTVAHIHLLRTLATSNASAISKFAPPLLRLSLDILLTPAATTSWQLRLSAVHLLESLLKAADYTVLAAHLHPSLAALSKCRRHDKLPQVRGAVLQALQTAEALQRQQIKQSVKSDSSTVNHRRQRSDPFGNNTPIALPSQISPSPLTSPRRLASLSARAATNALSPLDAEADYLFPFVCSTEEISPSHVQVIHSTQEALPSTMKCAKLSPGRICSRKPSPNRPVRVPSLKLPNGQGRPYASKDLVRMNSNADDSCLPSARAGYVPAGTDECQVPCLSSSSSPTRNIRVLGSTDELLASCERHLAVIDNGDHVSWSKKSSLRGQFAEAKFAGESDLLILAENPPCTTRHQAVNTEIRQQNGPNSMADTEVDSPLASVQLFHSLAQLATVDKCEDATKPTQQGTLPADNTPDLLETERVLSSFALTDSENSHTQIPNLKEPVDIEAETSSGEWSVRDNPIAEDHSEDMVKHKDTNPWPHISTALHEEVNKQWSHSNGADADGTLQSGAEQRCKLVTGNAIPSAVGEGACFYNNGVRPSLVAEEFWTEIEDLRDQTASSESGRKAEPHRKSSQFHNKLHLKVLLCAGLILSITMTLLTKELQHHASAQYLPPT